MGQQEVKIPTVDLDPLYFDVGFVSTRLNLPYMAKNAQFLALLLHKNHTPKIWVYSEKVTTYPSNQTGLPTVPHLRAIAAFTTSQITRPEVYSSTLGHSVSVN